MTSICDNAFYESGLVSVTLPRSLERIGSSAFGSNPKLRDVWFGGARFQWNQISAQADVSENAEVHCASELDILAQPQDVKGTLGQTARILIDAGDGELTYQWQYRDVGGSWSNSSFKTASIAVKITADRDGRQYRCIVKDALGNRIISDPATIIVVPALTITQQPQDFEGKVGESASFSVKATGDGLTYRWQYKDVGGSWANSSFKTASISCKITAARDGRLYRCIVSDAYGNKMVSDAASITVKTSLAITQQPQDFEGPVGSTAAFTVKATGEGLKYQWQYKDPGGSWLNSSFKAAAMSCKLTAARDGRQYRCIVMDADGNKVISDAATMIVKAGFAITSQPQSFEGKIGDTAIFSVTATGDGLAYQWQYKDQGGTWKNSSFKTATMSCKLTASRDGRQYRCVVTDVNGSKIISDAAVMTVVP